MVKAEALVVKEAVRVKVEKVPQSEMKVVLVQEGLSRKEKQKIYEANRKNAARSRILGKCFR